MINEAKPFNGFHIDGYMYAKTIDGALIPIGDAPAKPIGLIALTAEYAERDRWRITEDEPPLYDGKYEAYWPDENPDFDNITPEAVFDSRTNRWRIQGLPKAEQPTHWRPLRTDKPKGETSAS